MQRKPQKARKALQSYYFYEHVNGKIIAKPAFVCEHNTTPYDYFDSPFVKRWWRGDEWPEDLMDRYPQDEPYED